jgi:catalase (peroxidase I)
MLLKGPLLVLAVCAQSQAELEKVKERLTAFLNSVPQLAIRTFVRMSFHDLGNFDPSHPAIQTGPHGCLRDSRILGFNENGNLGRGVSNLIMMVENTISGHNISYGDIFSFAGKLAVEAAYPCLRIPWGYGRPKCTEAEKVSQKPMLPAGTLNTMQGYDPLLNRYGFSAEDFAILLMGAHGIQAASASVVPSGFSGRFANINSGKDFIKKTFETQWMAQRSGLQTPTTQYTSNLTSAASIIRIPSDMVFFPSVLQSIHGAEPADEAAKPVENRLKDLSTTPRSRFDKEFARVYTKMLNIGVDVNNLTPFIDTPAAGECKE